MAVEPEKYGLNETQHIMRKASILEVSRSKNGDWRVKVNVEIETRLPDGRLVFAMQDVSIPAKAEKKPHPNPTWLHGKRK